VREVLDVIGEQLDRAARRQAQRSLAQRRARRIASWLWDAPHDGRRRSWWRSPRPLVVLLVALAGTGGVAYGAARLFGVGAPAPRSSDPTVKLYVTTHSQLLAVRAADPRGGPAWGVEVSFEAHTPNPYGLSAVCVAVGRVVDGRIGYLGEDGAFHADGLFHAAGISSGLIGGLFPNLDRGPDNCTGPSQPHATLTTGSLAGGFSTGEIVANGLDGCGLGPPPPIPASVRRHEEAHHRHGRPLSARARKRLQIRILRSERDDLQRQLTVLRDGGQPARALAQRAGVSIRALRNIDAAELPLLTKELKAGVVLGPSIARCPTKALRTYWQGFAGPTATTVTLVAGGHRLQERVNPQQQGAYLFVLDGPTGRWDGWRMLVTCGTPQRTTRALSCVTGANKPTKETKGTTRATTTSVTPVPGGSGDVRPPLRITPTTNDQAGRLTPHHPRPHRRSTFRL
jgi:hypothetical protein